MKNLWGIVFVFVGCMPQEMTQEEELVRARAEKDKHPEQWRKLEKITPAEATQHQRKCLKNEIAHNKEMIEIESEYRCG